MRKTMAALTAASALMVGAFLASSAGASETKTICHQGTTIEVPHSLVWQHFKETGGTQPGHEGDYFGECKTTTTTVPDQPTTTTTTVPVCEENCTPPPTIPPPVVVCNVDGEAVEVAPGAPCPVPDEPDFAG